MSHRLKKNQHGKGDKRVTIDAKHNEQLKMFKNLKKTIPEYEENIKDILQQIEVIKNELANIDTTSNEYIKLSNNKMELEDEIENIKKKIVEIMDDKTEHHYYLSAGPYVMQYFVNKENISKGEIVGTNNSSKTKLKPYDKNILDFFMEHNQKKNDTSNTSNDTSNEVNIPVSKPVKEIAKESISFAFNDKHLKQKTKQAPAKNKNNGTGYASRLGNMSLDVINDKYMNMIDSNYISKHMVEEADLDYCYDCQIEMKLHQTDGRLVCPGCGVTQKVLVESDKQSCKDPPKEIVCMGYKRINHFRECVAQVQAKETTDIPDELYDQIIFELKKEKFHNMAELTHDKLKEILRKIKKNKYYEHIPHIINQLNGLPPPTYSKELQVILDRMFNEIQIPFQKYRPRHRKNFLSYSYVLYKFFELLEMKEYSKNFNLLKSREKLYNQDLIWKKITKALGWRFIKSI